ncbi:MAG TPA: class I SAM-dependent methyltransferase [Candidatus Acidoferrales bacterium]|nr:class I SAM-dependent methyltransferase [Candidatus Acidoferrales bacterium]
MDCACRVCGAANLEPLIDFGATPIAHRLLTQRDADEEVFPFALSLCARCSLVQVADPIDPAVLYKGYNYNLSSWKFEPHLEDEIEKIAQLMPRTVLEIGANDGRFLDAVRERTGATCLGLEPNPIPGARARERGFTIFESWASEAVAAQIVAQHGKVDLVVARQVFEHVLDLQDFLRTAKRAVRLGGHLFIDVPDFAPACRLGDSSVLWEEHVNYFTESTLLAILAREGFESTWVGRYDFSGGTVAILAQLSDTSDPHALPSNVATELDAARNFPVLLHEFGGRLKRALSRARTQGVRIMLYGVGVRSCAAANMLGLGPLIDDVVDDQIERQGKFMPGTRLEILSSDIFEKNTAPALCILAVNNESESVVRKKVDAKARAPVWFLSVCGPSDIWGPLASLEAATWAA